MTWFRVDDGLHSHRKVRSIPRKDRAAAMGLWVMAGAWCSDNLTDGHVPAYMIGELGCPPRLATALVRAGLWTEVRAESAQNRNGSDSKLIGYSFHDWQQSNPTREHVEGEREAARERMRRLRSAEHPRTSGEPTANFGARSALVRDPRPVPSRPSSGGTGSQSALGRTAPRQSDGPDLAKIARHLGSDERWAKRVADQVLDRAPTDVRDPTAYVLRAVDERPADYRPTRTAPKVGDLCWHGNEAATCPWRDEHEATA